MVQETRGARRHAPAGMQQPAGPGAPPAAPAHQQLHYGPPPQHQPQQQQQQRHAAPQLHNFQQQQLQQQQQQPMFHMQPAAGLYGGGYPPLHPAMASFLPHAFGQPGMLPLGGYNHPNPQQPLPQQLMYQLHHQQQLAHRQAAAAAAAAAQLQQLQGGARRRYGSSQGPQQQQQQHIPMPPPPGAPGGPGRAPPNGVLVLPLPHMMGLALAGQAPGGGAVAAPAPPARPSSKAAAAPFAAGSSLAAPATAVATVPLRSGRAGSNKAAAGRAASAAAVAAAAGCLRHAPLVEGASSSSGGSGSSSLESCGDASCDDSGDSLCSGPRNSTPGGAACGGGTSAMVAPRPPAQGEPSWAWLVESVLQQVVVCLQGNAASLAAFRATCQHWRGVASATIQSLAPSALMPKDLPTLFPRLRVLELVSCRNVRNRDLFVLSQAGMHLTCLTLGDDTNKPWVTNRGLDSIGRMSSIRRLALHDCNSITNNGMSALLHLGRLDTLSLRGCRKITNSGLELLAALTSITSLNLYGCKRLSDKGLKALAPLPLRALSLGHSRVKDQGLVWLAAMTALTELHFVGEDVREAGLASLAALPGLASLALRCCNLSDNVVLSLLPRLTALRELSLSGNPAVGNSLMKAGALSLQGLTALDLRETMVSDAGLCEATQLVNLRRLALKPAGAAATSGSCPGPEGYQALGRLTQLTALALALPAYGEGQVARLRELTRLQELDLSGMFALQAVPPAACEPLSPTLLAALASMTRLRTLNLSRRAISERGLAKLLRKLPRLQQLLLHEVPVAPEALAQLERSYPQVTILRRSHAADNAPDLAAISGSLSAS